MVERLTMRYIGEMRIRIASTGEGAADLVEKLDHQLAQQVADFIREKLGIGPHKEHPWAGKGKVARK
jgi:hypothetical protein